MVAVARDRKSLEAIEAPLQSLGEKHPDDLSVRIASALAAMAGGDPGRIRVAIDALNALVERTPLESLPEEHTAMPAASRGAARQLPLWLVARACWKQVAWRASGDRFAARAIEAARRQSDNRWALAMLREQGEQALERKDTGKAEADWSRMLELILARKPERKGPSGAAIVAMANPARTADAAPHRPRVPARPRDRAPRRACRPSRPRGRRQPHRPPRGRTSTATAPPRQPASSPSTRFEQAMQVARLAADNRPDRGADAGPYARPSREVRRSVTTPRPAVGWWSSGPVCRPTNRPTRPPPAWSRSSRSWTRPGGADGHRPVRSTRRSATRPSPRVGRLRSSCMPSPLVNASVSHQRSLGVLMADWAVRAGKVDDLRGRLESRQSRPMAEFPAAVLSAQLALAAGDAERTNRALGAIGGRIQRGAVRTMTDMACHAALPALDRPETRGAALAVLDAAIKGQLGTDATDSVRSLILVVARRQLQAGDVAGEPTLARGVPRIQRPQRGAVQRRLSAVSPQDGPPGHRRRAPPTLCLRDETNA